MTDEAEKAGKTGSFEASRPARRTPNAANESCVLLIPLSKSEVIAGVQLLKRLYLQVDNPELAADGDEGEEARLEQGHAPAKRTFREMTE